MEPILVIRKKNYTTKKKMLSYIAEELNFPDYFGNNLDALYDCLTDIDEPINIALDPIPSDESEKWYQGIYKVLLDAAAENENMKLFVAIHVDSEDD